MLSALLALVVGLIVLLVSAHYFVKRAAAGARHFGMPPPIGMVVVGFGTSAPEMVVSVLAAHQGNPGIALGNAYGSNIVNIALILGLTALIRPGECAAAGAAQGVAHLTRRDCAGCMAGLGRSVHPHRGVGLATGVHWPDAGQHLPGFCTASTKP